jgi:hypothetical protein
VLRVKGVLDVVTSRDAELMKMVIGAHRASVALVMQGQPTPAAILAVTIELGEDQGVVPVLVVYDESRRSCAYLVEIEVAVLALVGDSVDAQAAAIAAVMVVACIAAIERVLVMAEVI